MHRATVFGRLCARSIDRRARKPLQQGATPRVRTLAAKGVGEIVARSWREHVFGKSVPLHGLYCLSVHSLQSQCYRNVSMPFLGGTLQITRLPGCAASNAIPAERAAPQYGRRGDLCASFGNRDVEHVGTIVSADLGVDRCRESRRDKFAGASRTRPRSRGPPP
jgi:hypothetical protein